MDLIRRQDAINAIHCDITVTGRQNAELVSETIATFVDRIKALPSAQQWIPCSERLPEVKIGWDSEVNTYLVTVDDGAIYTDIDIIRTSGFNKYGSNVTAWMPLPEPYKGGDTNDVS